MKKFIVPIKFKISIKLYGIYVLCKKYPEYNVYIKKKLENCFMTLKIGWLQCKYASLSCTPFLELS